MNELLNDSNISFKAKGLFICIQNKQQESGSRLFSIKKIETQGKESRDAIRSGLQELEKYGYLVRRMHREDGKLIGVEYILIAHPTEESFATDEKRR